LRLKKSGAKTEVVLHFDVVLLVTIDEEMEQMRRIRSTDFHLQGTTRRATSPQKDTLYNNNQATLRDNAGADFRVCC
jgi:hypothetical protein